MENDNLKDRLREKFIEWSETTTAHGIPNFVVAKKNFYLRLLWFLFFIVSLVACICITTKSFIEYYEYKVTVSIDEHKDIPSAFPTVTICNVNGLKYEYIKDFAVKSRHQSNCTNDLGSCAPSELNSISKGFRNSLKAFLNLFNRSLSGYSLNLRDNMLLSCTYNQNSCTAGNFTESWNNQYGNCYTFNGDSKLVTYVSGSKLGLELSLVLQRPNDESYSDVQSGLYLLIENRTSHFKLDLYTASGLVTNIGIKRTFKKKLSRPYSDCIQDLTPFSAYSKRIYGYFETIMNRTEYFEELCYQLCFEDKLIVECKCSQLTKLAKTRNVPQCNTDEQKVCLDAFNSRFYAENVHSTCEFICEDPCDMFVYTVNRNEFLFKDYAHLRYLSNLREYETKIPRNLNKTAVVTYAQKNFARVKIYYEDLVYTLVEDIPQRTLTELLGDIGGQLGLFIGISLLSFMEIIELLSELLLTSVNFFRRKRAYLKRRKQGEIRETHIL